MYTTATGSTLHSVEDVEARVFALQEAESGETVTPVAVTLIRGKAKANRAAS